MISGEQWRQSVPLDNTNYQVLERGIAEREQAAGEWVKQAQLHELERGITSCINRGSDSLALPLPTEIALTSTLRQFMDQLAKHGLIVDIALAGDEPGEALLLVAPRR